MRSSRIVLCLLVGLTVSCASTLDGVDTSNTPESRRAATYSSAAPASAPAVPLREPITPRTSNRRSGLDASELAIWNNARFKRWFLESYLSETEIEPRVTERERDLIYAVRDLIGAGKVDEALAKLEKESGKTSSAVIDFTIANLYVQEEQLEQAVPAYEAAVEKFPKFRRAWQNLGLTHVRLGEYEKALPALIEVIELGGGSSITYGLMGFAYLTMGNHLSAESAYRTAVLLDAKTTDWQEGLARSLFEQERYAEAASLFGNLIERNPENADLWLLQANTYIGMNQPIRAAQNYELVDRLGKSTPDSLENLGDIYVNEELFDLAVGSYKRAMDMDPARSPARALRAAKVLAARGALAETRELVGQIERLHGDRLETGDRKDLLKLRSRLAVADGAGDEEARVLEEIVELDPLDGEALILLGLHAFRGGDLEKAAFYYERAAAIEAYEAEGKKALAQVLVRQKKYAEAIPLLERALALQPSEGVRDYLRQIERLAQSR